MSEQTQPAADIWDLDSIFDGGSQSAPFAGFLVTLRGEIGDLRETSRDAATALDEDRLLHAWGDRVTLWQSCVAALDEATSFVECLSA